MGSGGDTLRSAIWHWTFFRVCRKHDINLYAWSSFYGSWWERKTLRWEAHFLGDAAACALKLIIAQTGQDYAGVLTGAALGTAILNNGITCGMRINKHPRGIFGEKRLGEYSLASSLALPCFELWRALWGEMLVILAAKNALYLEGGLLPCSRTTAVIHGGLSQRGTVEIQIQINTDAFNVNNLL